MANKSSFFSSRLFFFSVFFFSSPFLPFLFFFFLFLKVFNEGEEGMSWYIILKGSVNVVVHGKVRNTNGKSSLLSIMSRQVFNRSDNEWLSFLRAWYVS